MEASENATHRHENKYKKRKEEKNRINVHGGMLKARCRRKKLNKCSSMKMIDHSQRKKKDAEKSLNWKMNERSLDDLLWSVDQLHSMLQRFVDIEHIGRVIVRFSINN